MPRWLELFCAGCVIAGLTLGALGVVVSAFDMALARWLWRIALLPVVPFVVAITVVWPLGILVKRVLGETVQGRHD